MSSKIAVIGGGVQGLASALCISDRCPNNEITVIAEEFYPENDNICSSHGLGIVISARSSRMDNKQIADRVVATLEYCSALPPVQAKKMGILRTDAIVFYNETEESLNQQVTKENRLKFGYQRLNEVEMKPYNYVKNNGIMFYHDFKEGQWIVFRVPTYVIDLNLYLPWLTSQLKQKISRNGKKMVKFERRKINSFAELGPYYHLVVNCSGLGAGKLVSDPNLVSMRGQYIRVSAPLINEVLHAGETIIVPRSKDVGMGITAQAGRYDTAPDPEDTADIKRRCEALCPALKKAKFLSSEVGLRPSRVGGARVDSEILQINPKESSEIRSLPIIHNYGHGGKGFAQHWGCALEVSSMASHYLQDTAKL